jgi:hypothetical protein
VWYERGTSLEPSGDFYFACAAALAAMAAVFSSMSNPSLDSFKVSSKELLKVLLILKTGFVRARDLERSFRIPYTRAGETSRSMTTPTPPQTPALEPLPMPLPLPLPLSLPLGGDGSG